MEDELQKIRGELDALRSRVAELEKQIQDGGSAFTTASDLRSFVEATDPSSNTERALAICYYLEFHDDSKGITSRKLDERYKECRLPPPANSSDVLRRAGENGWLMRRDEEEGSTLWCVTADGQQIIENRTAQE